MNIENISMEVKSEMVYGVQQMKQLCPAPTTRIDETWTQVVDTIKNGSHPLGHNLFN
jgi:hypothetical protein